MSLVSTSLAGDWLLSTACHWQNWAVVTVFVVQSWLDFYKGIHSFWAWFCNMNKLHPKLTLPISACTKPGLDSMYIFTFYRLNFWTHGSNFAKKCKNWLKWWWNFGKFASLSLPLSPSLPPLSFHRSGQWVVKHPLHPPRRGPSTKPSTWKPIYQRGSLTTTP